MISLSLAKKILLLLSLVFSSFFPNALWKIQKSFDQKVNNIVVRNYLFDETLYEVFKISAV